MNSAPCHLVFALATANCDALTVQALQRVRRAYPQARIVLVSDHSSASSFDDAANAVSAELVRSEPLYVQAAGARHWRVLLGAACDGPCDVLFKIDPDTWVRRPFRSLPDPQAVQVFGTPFMDAQFVDRPHLQGGCNGITRAAIDRMRASDVLYDEGYKRPDYAQSFAIHPRHIADRQRNGRLSTDLIFADMCYRLEIPLVRHPEVHSLWLRAEDERAWHARGIREPVNSPDDAYAVTHPHKL